MATTEFVRKLELSCPADRWVDFSSVVAVSGGPDSVALLRGLHEIHVESQGQGQLAAGHINHQFRQPGSDQDARFVRELSAKLGLPFMEIRLDQPIPEKGSPGLGLEATWRRARYRALEDLARKLGGRYLFTGHTADDQVETILFRVLRGTGVGGLAGIPRVRVIQPALSVIRPLLKATRQEVMEYLDSLRQPYRLDQSNEDRQFTRNRIRHQILPFLRQQFGDQVDASILGLGDQASSFNALIDRLIAPILRDYFQVNEGNFRVRTASLTSLDGELIKYALRAAWQQAGFAMRDMTADKWNVLAEWLQSPQGAEPRPLTLPGGVHARREGELAILQKWPPPEGDA